MPLLAFQVRVTVCCCAVPVPLSDSVVCGVAALLVKDNVPETVALAVGVKDTLNEELCPAGIVKGKVAPCSTNCELLLASEVTVPFAPVALKVMACVPVEPIVTSPKFNADGVRVNCPAVVTPVPLRGRFTGPLDALLLNVSDPEIVPLAAGIKAALSVKLCPAAIVNGKDAPVKANCVLLLVSDDTVTLPPLALTVIA